MFRKLMTGLFFTLACHAATGDKPEEVDCLAVTALQQALRDTPRLRPPTYDQHAQIDTAADAVTRGKGCILVAWIERHDSIHGGLLTDLGSLVSQGEIDSLRYPALEWREDGWRRGFAFERSDSSFSVVSNGQDGVEGTVDDLRFPGPR